MKKDIKQILTISTSHIKPSTAEALANNHETGDLPVSVYNKGDFGWFIYFSPNNINHAKELPKDLHDCILLAKENNCQILCLDCDAPTMDSLPTFSYEGVEQAPISRFE